MVILNWILIGYSFVFCLSTTILHTAINIPFLILTLLLYIVSLMGRAQHAAFPWIRLILIGLIHYIGNSSFCLPIYILTLFRDIYTEENRKKSWILVASYALIFLFNVYLVKGPSGLLWVYALNSMLDFTAVALLTRATYSTFTQADRLKKERNLYSQQDSLTGLYNYEESHRRLELLIRQKQGLVLILIDCTDLKAMNTSRGFQAGNFILKQMAELLQILFKDALFIARYGGDEFAVVMPLIQEHLSTASFKLKLDSELPKLTGIQITYGIASYPLDGLTKDDLILLAENNLFMKKRESWLKREEHMLRSDKLRVIGELASGMAHEIRNPLTTVKGFLQISKANGYNIENWYSLIMDEINRMSDLTAEFLQFSKPHSIDFRVHSLHECVLKVIALMESEATRFGHQIHYKESMNPVFVLMDQDKMIQLLLNIIKNACEAMEENGVVHMQLSLDPKNATMVIADNGPGIPTEQLEKIFHPFFTTKAAGTGLGLSICYKIVQDHQGTLEVESELGIGTRFIITFPLAEKDSNVEKAANN
ncbi:diguanylate cyclase (GGDEF) domain-containing protein [Paenibacillus sp. yr247]|uniref:ATP-binding protein n=1 Tax=Paenibacillus sp. yr247 TaxID=1761880 RepID=UPI000882F3E0|nr:ATP-binding protein [Paenibacillus sp. yr247]SDM93064.1 diguanylate cyclase (GGDEF) domain-containing protein [Paenibacillus sp. yr247]